MSKIEWPPPIKFQDAPSVTSEGLKKLHAKSQVGHLELVMTDSEYTALTVAQWNKVLTACNEETLPYVKTIHDCDDFAFLMRGLVPAVARVNGVGAVLDFKGKHAYNVVLVVDGTTHSIEIVEPQLDAFVPKTDIGKAPYSGSAGIAIW